MTLRQWGMAVALAAVSLAGAAARAQSPIDSRGGEQVLSAGGSFSAVHFQYGQHWVLGGSAFVDANFNWHYGLEGEGNWSRWHTQSDTWATTYLIGPRYQITSFRDGRYVPYAKFLVGDGTFNFPYSYGYGNYLVMAPGAGVDFRWKPRIDIRLCDFEYQYWPDFTFGSNTNLSVSAGIRYHIF